MGKRPEPSWRTRNEAAAELSELLGRPITRNTINERWLAIPGNPFPKGKAKIPKAPVIAWVKARLANTGAPAADSPVQKLKQLKIEEELRALRRKNAEKEHLTVPADEVRASINLAMAGLKRELLEDLPATIWTECQRTPLEVAIVAIRRLMVNALNAFASTAAAAIPEPESAPAAAAPTPDLVPVTAAP